MKPVLAVASALACGLLLPLGTGAVVWLAGCAVVYGVSVEARARRAS